MTSCYDCIHQSLCFVHKDLKSGIQGPLQPKTAEWYTEFFTMVGKACLKFKPHEKTIGNFTKLYCCISCGHDEFEPNSTTRDLQCSKCKKASGIVRNIDSDIATIKFKVGE